MQQRITFSVNGEFPGLAAAAPFSSTDRFPSHIPVNPYATMSHPEEPVAIAIETLSVFEEATQTATRFLNLPIAALGLPAGHDLVFKAAVGLSHLGFMNPLARTRRLPLSDGLIQASWGRSPYLLLEDVTSQSDYQGSALVEQYGIKAFMALPLHTSDGQPLGLLMVMDTQPHPFSDQAIAFMEMIARWAVSEYERQTLLQKAAIAPAGPAAVAPHPSSSLAMLDRVRLDLISQLTQELRPPLTSITGMAGMLSREIYGPLTPKQQEYTDIVSSSSQKLLETVDEIIELGHLNPAQTEANPIPLDIEMVGQQVVNGLANLAKQREQELLLTVEPRSRLWILDRQILKHLLYHLVFCVLHISGEGGTIRIHASQREQGLSLAVWLSNPWLGEGLPNSVVAFQPYLSTQEAASPQLISEAMTSSPSATGGDLGRSREVLALILSRHLAESCGGSLTLQGNPEAGYRFVVMLPAQVAQSAE